MPVNAIRSRAGAANGDGRHVNWRNALPIALALSATIVAASHASGQSRTESPTAEAIAIAMEKARTTNRDQLRPYVVTRVYTLFGRDEAEKKSEVTADITFAPPNVKQYTIVHSSGSSLGLKIVRRMLDGETQIVKDFGATDLSSANYELRLVREEVVAGRRCFLVELLPRRNEKRLLRGMVWIDADTYLLRRVDAEPAKSPSWWLQDVRLAFFYGDVKGMWLQTSSELTTNVRVFGPHRMVSRDIRYQTADRAGAEVERSAKLDGGQTNGRQEQEREGQERQAQGCNGRGQDQGSRHRSSRGRQEGQEAVAVNPASHACRAGRQLQGHTFADAVNQFRPSPEPRIAVAVAGARVDRNGLERPAATRTSRSAFVTSRSSPARPPGLVRPVRVNDSVKTLPQEGAARHR